MIPGFIPQIGFLRRLGQTSSAWVTVKPGLNGDWFSVEVSNIYRQGAGVGRFTLWLATGIAGIVSFALSPDGAYGLFVTNVIDGSNNIYRVDMATKAVTQAGAGPTNIRGLCIAPNGDWYVSTVGAGDIYVKVGGSGSWVAVGLTDSWADLCAASSGHIYAAGVNGVAKRTSGSGNFSYVDSNARGWRGICAFSGSDGDELYATSGSLLYKRAVSGGDFVGIAGTSRSTTWRQLGMDQQRNFYAPDLNGDIYKSINGF